jgi:hypothetical protein
MGTGKLENGQGQGEIAIGTSISLGGGLFFPIVDFAQSGILIKIQNLTSRS